VTRSGSIARLQIWMRLRRRAPRCRLILQAASSRSRGGHAADGLARRPRSPPLPLTDAVLDLVGVVRVRRTEDILPSREWTGPGVLVLHHEHRSASERLGPRRSPDVMRTRSASLRCDTSELCPAAGVQLALGCPRRHGEPRRTAVDHDPHGATWDRQGRDPEQCAERVAAHSKSLRAWGGDATLAVRRYWLVAHE
jgi:hypothetical protein